MRVYIVSADVQDRDEYRDYTTPRVMQHSWGIFIRRGTPPNTFE